MNEDIFRKVKADVASMGSLVKEMLVRRYKVEDLQGLYTNDELETIGFSFVDNVNHSSSTLTFGAYGLSNSQIFVATYDTDGNLTKFEKADAKSESMTVGTGFAWGKIYVWDNTNKSLQNASRFY